MEITWRNTHGEKNVQISITLFAIICVTSVLFYAYAMTEILSLFHALTSLSVVISWGLLAAVLGCISLRKRIEIKRVRYAKESVPLLKIIIAILIFVSLIALLTVPYNYDSMTYHLARVMNWKQNRSVDYYATNIPRQLFNGPLAEYLILQLELTVGIENTFNLVQTGAYIASIGALYGISRKIGLEKRVCYFVCIVFMTTPIVMVEATTTQNDLVACMWSLFGIYILADYLTTDRIDLSLQYILKTVLLATICVMCYLTKGTACITLLPFIATMGIVRILKKDKLVHLAGHLCISGCWIIVTLLPSFYRNFQLYGSFLGLGNYSNVMIETLHPKYLLLNGIKNLTTHLTFNNLKGLNPVIEQWVVHTASVLKVEVNDPLITWMGESFSMTPGYSCDTAKVPIVITLTLLSVIVFLWAYKYTNRIQKIFYLVSTIAWLMAFFLIKWQPWITRLTICVMACMCIAVGIAFNAIIKKKRAALKVLYMTILICVACALPVASNLMEVSKFTMHNYGWFYSKRSNRESYTLAAETVKNNGYEKVGLKTGEDTWEYPLWRMLEHSTVSSIRHIMPEDVSLKILEDVSFVPDCILVIDLPGYNLFTVLDYSGYKYGCVAEYDNVLLFEKDFSNNTTEYLPTDSSVFADGFADPENNHIWMTDDQSSMILKCSERSGKKTYVRVSYSIYGEEQRIRVIAGGETLYEDQIGRENPGYIDLEIPADAFEGDMLRLTFEHPDAVSPYETDGTPDTRRLSFDITRINIFYE